MTTLNVIRRLEGEADQMIIWCVVDGWSEDNQFFKSISELLGA